MSRGKKAAKNPKLLTVFDKMENVIHFAEMTFTSEMITEGARKIIFIKDIIPVLKGIPDVQNVFAGWVASFDKQYPHFIDVAVTRFGQTGTGNKYVKESSTAAASSIDMEYIDGLMG